MTTRTWIRRLFAYTPRTVRKAQSRIRPRLEVLEDRLAPATLTVNSLADNTTDTTVMTLRAAVDLIDSGGTSVAAPGAATVAPAGAQTVSTGKFGTNDTIQFQASLSGGAIDLSTADGDQGTLTLSRDVTIDGTGASITVEGGKIAGSSNAQPFVINSGVTATLENLTISNGYSGGDGGGIYNQGTLTLSNCTLSDNSTTHHGGGIDNNDGSVTLSNCTLSGNSALLGGGLSNINGTLTVSNCTLSGNSAGRGGDIFNVFAPAGNNATNSTATLNNTIVAKNTAGIAGDDIFNLNGGTLKGDSNVIGTAVTVNGTSLLTNTITTQDPKFGPLADNGGLTQTMALLPGSPAILSLREAINLANACEKAGNSAAITFAAGVGGHTITLTQGQLELTAGAGTTSIDGGAAGVTVEGGSTALSSSNAMPFVIDSGVTAVLNDLTISNGSGGPNVFQNEDGGGIYNAGTLTVSNCTLTGNFNKNGSAIYNAAGTLTVSNCTLSGNFAGLRGTIYNAAGALTTVSNCTLSQNSTAVDPQFPHNGGIYNDGSMTMNNTIVANTTNGVDISNFGTLIGSNDLIDDKTAGTDGTNGLFGATSQYNVAAGLDPNGLQDNGGPTKTIALQFGSLALTKGDSSLLPNDPSTGKPYATDQRGPGFPRVVNGQMDIGAYEVQPPTVQFSAAAETVPESAGSFSITVTLSGAFGQDVSVPFTLGGSAVSGTDYSGVTASPLTIKAGQTSGTITGTLPADPGASPTLKITLSPPANASLGATTVNTLTIVEPPALAVPGAQTAYENVAQAISGITVGASQGDSLMVKLSVGHGTLTLTTSLKVTGNGPGSVTLAGSADQLNATLNSLVYLPNHDYSGADALSITVSDGSLKTSGSVAITVKSIAQLAADLQAKVAALQAAGVLNQGQANSLIVKLNLQGNSGDADKVQAFLQEAYDLLGPGNTLLVPGNNLLLSVTRR
jgi:hypothetical protein